MYKFQDRATDSIILFWLLLVYSLLPGLAKFLDFRFIFILNIPIILIVFFKTFKLNGLRYTDIPFLIFIGFVIGYIPLSFFFPLNSGEAIFYGIYTFLMPTLGYFIGSAFSVSSILKIYIKICLIHGVIGWILYPYFFFDGYLNHVIDPVLSGSAYLRMTSVSGSLGFSPLMLIGFNIILSSFFISNSKEFKFPVLLLLFFCCCIILSLQRSAWLGGVVSLLLVVFRNLFILKINLIKLFKLMSLFAFSSIFIFFLIKYDLFDLEKLNFFLDRKDSFTSAANERNQMWVNGLSNFYKFPTGVGLGQVGLVPTFIDSKNYYSGVTDGDFIKTLSETGFIGLIFYSFIVLIILIMFFNIHILSIQLFTLFLIIIAFSIQMIGTNISELYFVNYSYWLFVGLFFRSVNFSNGPK